jgi:ATP-dependent Lon protease
MPDAPETKEPKDPTPAANVFDVGFESSAANVLKELPKQIPLLPLRSDVPFPQVIMPLIVGRDKGILLLDDIMKGPRIVGLATQTNLDAEDPGSKDLYPTICVAHVLKLLKFPDGSTRIVAQGLRRARWTSIARTEPYLVANIAAIQEVDEVGVETEALMLSIRRLLEKFVEAGGQAPEELQVAAMNTPEPSAWCDLLASGLPFSTEEKQELLAESNVKQRLKRLHQLLRYQVEMHSLSSKISNEASGELNRAQRETFLRQQMSAIKRELGEGEEEGGEIRELYDRLDQAKLPEAAHNEAKRELDRMQQMHPSTPEYHVIRTFLETMFSMPWHISTEDRIDIRRARRILDEDHYGLEQVKQRILEFLSVRKLKEDMRGPILCFVGPPGVGKTSLGKSIARTMDRKFTRISLGGVHDEAEIRGHRRTYIGAMPGRIIQGLRKLGVNNPVFMLDEIDKLGSDHRGDPSSALLEVLDPEQNNSFRDHYLDVEFDLSKVLFICTANVLQTIPSPLRDRMEVIEISGYSEEEKLAIAKKYLIPKQMREHGLPADAASFSDDGIRFLIDGYTHEAGLRNLEREIASLCRKIARQYAEGKRKKVSVDAKRIEHLLNAPKIIHDRRVEATSPGVATGLAWTPVGGVTLSIESARAPGKSSLKLTGSLGDVMKESAHAALSYLRGHSDDLGIPKDFFDDGELHVHVPAGAIAKDGPSAGVAMLASLLSLAVGKPLRQGLAMTGEITLSGRVLAVGGVREKILAARREGIDTVIVPMSNEKEVSELPKYLRDEFTFIFAKQIDEVLPHLFSSEKRRQPRKSKAKIVRGKNYGKPRPASAPSPAP